MIKFIALFVFSCSAIAGSVSYDSNSAHDNRYFSSADTLGTGAIQAMSYSTFNITGIGSVNAAAHQSYSVWAGITSGVQMRGVGSAHGFTTLGELYSNTYNELGGFQAELTNMGSVNGTISGVEMLLKDSPNQGASSYPTKLQPVVSRIAKYNNGTKADSFYASSEGIIPPNSILTGNPGGSWSTGIDFGSQQFTSGYAAIFPNNFALAWKNINGSSVPVFSYNQTGTVFFTDNRMRFVYSAGGGVYNSIMELDSSGLYMNVGGVMKKIVVAPASSCGNGFSCLAVSN